MDITPSLLALQLVTGIALGAIYALLALGLSLIFGMLTVVNFAHGAFFMVGAFVGLYFMGLTGNFWFSLVLTPLVVGAIGLVTERFLVRPLYGRGIDYPLLLTFGLSWVLIEAMRILFGIEGMPSSTPPALRGAVDLGIGFFPKKLFDDAQALLKRIVEEKWVTASGIVGFWPANSVGDDIEVYSGEPRHTKIATLYTLRQQIARDRLQVGQLDAIAQHVNQRRAAAGNQTHHRRARRNRVRERQHCRASIQ